MASYWDSLPASLWGAATQPYLPPTDPTQTPPWQPAPPMPWDARGSTPDFLAWNGRAPSSLSGPRDSRRALDFVNWFFGPPSAGAPAAQTVAPGRRESSPAVSDGVMPYGTAPGMTSQAPQSYGGSPQGLGSRDPAATDAYDPLAGFATAPPAGYWPTPASVPPTDPGWSRSPAAPWESAVSTADYLAPDAMALRPSGILGPALRPSGILGPVFGGPAQPGTYGDQGSAAEDPAQKLAQAQRANDFVKLVLGPASAWPHSPAAAPMQADLISGKDTTVPSGEAPGGFFSTLLGPAPTTVKQRLAEEAAARRENPPGPHVPQSGVDDAPEPYPGGRAPPKTFAEQLDAFLSDDNLGYYAGELWPHIKNARDLARAIAPGAGTQRSFQDGTDAARDWQAGNHGTAGLDFLRGMLNSGTDLLPFSKLGRTSEAPTTIARATTRGERAPGTAAKAGAQTEGALDRANIAAAPGRAVKGVPEDANFAQNWYNEFFKKEGPLAGYKIDDIVAQVKARNRDPNSLIVHFIVRDGHTLIQNTRTAEALRRAGIPRSEWNARDMTGNDKAERDVSRQLGWNGLTNAGTPTVMTKQAWIDGGNDLFPGLKK